MIYLLAIWMYATPLQHVELVEVYDTMDECVHSGRISGFDPTYADYRYTILDNETEEDAFFLLCQTEAIEIYNEV